MSFDYKLLGKKFKEARESLLMSIEEVAKYLECDETYYNGIESGNITSLDGDTIILLSQKFERDFRYFVSGDYPSTESQVKELFRQNSKLTKNDRISIQKFIRLCEEKYNLELALGKEKNFPIDYSKKVFKSDNHKYQGISVAYLERQRLNISDSIDDIYGKLREQKIHIFRKALEDNNISGVYVKHPRVGHCILINYSDDIYRQNFSMAHEYGHVLFDSDREQNISYFNKEKDYVEIRANNFASNFLVPNDVIDKFNRIYINNIKFLKIEILNICRKYYVSSKVILNRLISKKIISRDAYKELIKDEELVISKMDKIDPELKDVSINMKDRLGPMIKDGVSIEYMELCRVAYQQDLISYGKMIECLQMPFESSKQLFDTWDVFMET
ncbi:MULTISPECIES: XRE family transcriptional regulator [unclassified Clostridium]|uniref:helix-turn-helix domain-containing protein n=1 Tax=unclassified Clostridium TaxID=2614128 RepID=UPI0020794640|nr:MULTISPECIES: XRE family transcriptional regulator [unclassified Clostridium]